MSKCEIDFKAHKCEFCSDCIHGQVCMWRSFPYDPTEHCQFFKDKSLFVELPVRLGQILYQPDDYHKCAEELKVSSLTQKKDGSWKIRLSHRYRWISEITVDKIDKTVFLTKEEAEQKLKEIEGK